MCVCRTKMYSIFKIVCVSVWGYMYVSAAVLGRSEVPDPSGAGVTDGCEAPDNGC